MNARTNTTSTQGSAVRRSFLGSIRDRLGRRPSTPRSPMANPSPRTRRPEDFHEPPPPYSPIAELSADPPSSAASAAQNSVTRSMPPAATLPPSTPVPRMVVTPPVARVSSPVPSNRSALSTNTRLTLESLRQNEDQYAYLSMFDTVFVIDDSGSMAGSPWKEVLTVLATIVPICTSRDADGIDLYFLNHRASPEQAAQLLRRPVQTRVAPGKSSGGFHNVTDPVAVADIFGQVRPGGATPTGLRLRSILQPYLRFYEAKRNEMVARGEYGDPDAADIKPMNIIVITDGVPSDDLEDVLIGTAKKLDAMDAPPCQVGVQFFQVGREPEAKAYLDHLDNTLGARETGAMRDIVDTVSWDVRVNNTAALSGENVLKAVLGAVVKRLDNASGTRTRSASRGPSSRQG